MNKRGQIFVSIVTLLSTVSALLFMLSLLSMHQYPDEFDTHLKAFVLAEVEAEVSSHISITQEMPDVDALDVLAERYKLQAQIIKREIDSHVPEVIGAFIAALCEADCKEQDAITKSVKEIWQSRLAQIGVGYSTTKELIQGHYARILKELRADISLFFLTQSVLLGLASLIALFDRRAGIHTAFVAAILLTSAGLCGIWYVFGQDWLWSIIFSDYWGIGYPIFSGFLAFLLADITWNRGRVTSAVFNFFGNVFGAVLSPIC